MPYNTDPKVAPIPNPRLDGFIAEDHHLDNITPGPEAYIINCPYMIRLGFNPTGINEGVKVFDRILSSFKIWQPPKQKQSGRFYEQNW